MKRRVLFLILVAGVILSRPSLFAQYKVNFGSPVKALPNYDLPFLAAEDKGLWKQWGLDVNWVAFESAGPLVRAIISKDMDIGAVGTFGTIPAVIQGAPLVAVAHHGVETDFRIWVRNDSRIRAPADLKGAKIAPVLLGGTTHRMGQVAARALGLEKDVKFVSIGGGPALVAGLRAGIVDAVITGFDRMAALLVAGVLRDVVRIREFLPSPWHENVLNIRRERLEVNPEPLRRATRAFLQAAAFVGENPAWAIAKLKATYDYSDQVAEMVYKVYRYDKVGRIDPVALENVIKFMKEYELIPREASVPIDKLYTNSFLE